MRIRIEPVAMARQYKMLPPMPPIPNENTKLKSPPSVVDVAMLYQMSVTTSHAKKRITATL